MTNGQIWNERVQVAVLYACSQGKLFLPRIERGGYVFLSALSRSRSRSVPETVAHGSTGHTCVGDSAADSDVVRCRLERELSGCENMWELDEARTGAQRERMEQRPSRGGLLPREEEGPLNICT